MAERDKPGSWNAVDAAPDREWFVGYLDRADEVPSIRGWKEAGFRALQLEPGLEVLEVGCGPGTAARAIAVAVGTGGRVVAIDVSTTMIQQARERSAGLELPLEFRVGDVYHLDFEDNSFDRVFADRVFQHLDNPVAALTETVRVLRPGGRVVTGDPDWGTLVVSHGSEATTRKMHTALEAAVRNHRIAREMPGLMVEAGLVDVEVAPVVLVMRDLEGAGPDGHHTTSLLRKVARESGAVSDEEIAQWTEAILAAEREGKLLISGLGFTTGGVKAAPRPS